MVVVLVTSEELSRWELSWNHNELISDGPILSIMAPQSWCVPVWEINESPTNTRRRSLIDWQVRGGKSLFRNWGINCPNEGISSYTLTRENTWTSEQVVNKTWIKEMPVKEQARLISNERGITQKVTFHIIRRSLCVKFMALLPFGKRTRHS